MAKMIVFVVFAMAGCSNSVEEVSEPYKPKKEIINFEWDNHNWSDEKWQ